MSDNEENLPDEAREEVDQLRKKYGDPFKFLPEEKTDNNLVKMACMIVEALLQDIIWFSGKPLTSDMRAALEQNLSDAKIMALPSDWLTLISLQIKSGIAGELKLISEEEFQTCSVLFCTFAGLIRKNFDDLSESGICEVVAKYKVFQTENEVMFQPRDLFIFLAGNLINRLAEIEVALEKAFHKQLISEMLI